MYKKIRWEVREMAYNHGKAERKWKLWIWITVFMQLFLVALDKIIFRD